MLELFAKLSNFFLLIANILLVIATGLLWRATLSLKKTSDLQFVIYLIAGFQNEWHSRVTRLMRRYLSEKKFITKLNEAIKEGYNREINYTDITQLLDPPANLNGALDKFKECLDKDIFCDPAKKDPLFTSYEALDHVLISFDRLALVRDKPLAIHVIKQYEPPIRDLKDVLQAFIAVTIALTKDEKKRISKKIIYFSYISFVLPIELFLNYVRRA